MSAIPQKSEVSQPLRKQIEVDVPQERAFRVFTENVDAWWPRNHKIGPAALKTAVMEPQQGGRWYEIDEDGSQCEWGKVLVWDPPRRLVLAWQINGEWQFDPELITEIEVIFTPEGPRRTRVDLEHRYLERMGPLGEGMRKTFESECGWPGLLGLFKQTAER